ncbi:MAG TPA: hypothetical protein VFF82_09020 [Rhodocyclaceae bacterium]|nr:hypothetical protein [Rhodocyclaceae bacterium]
MTTIAKNQSSWRRALLLMLALSLLPIAVGAGLYFFGWRPAQTSNHGTLIVPPAVVTIDAPRGKWSLVLIDDKDNADRLDELRRVRASLAKEWQRTQHLRLDASPTALGPLPTGSVIIVDPDGRAMMRYAPGADAKGVRADLERLLKYSWTG